MVFYYSSMNRLSWLVLSILFPKKYIYWESFHFLPAPLYFQVTLISHLEEHHILLTGLHGTTHQSTNVNNYFTPLLKTPPWLLFDAQIKSRILILGSNTLHDQAPDFYLHPTSHTTLPLNLWIIFSIPPGFLSRLCTWSSLCLEGRDNSQDQKNHVYLLLHFENSYIFPL